MKLSTRQELIEKALVEMSVLSIEPKWAIEVVLDGATGEAMEKYYDGLSDRAVQRLVAAIRRIHASR